MTRNIRLNVEKIKNVKCLYWSSLTQTMYLMICSNRYQQLFCIKFKLYCRWWQFLQTNVTYFNIHLLASPWALVTACILLLHKLVKKRTKTRGISSNQDSSIGTRYEEIDGTELHTIYGSNRHAGRKTSSFIRKPVGSVISCYDLLIFVGN